MGLAERRAAKEFEDTQFPALRDEIMKLAGAPIALAPTVIYPWYTEGPHPLGLTALADQELGGLLMWVGAGLYLMCVFSLIFFRWARREDRDEPIVGRPVARSSWG